MEVFGDFAIGLDPIEARALGAMPTFYYYRLERRSGGPSPSIPSHLAHADLGEFGPSSEILYRLAEMRALLIALAHVEARGAPADRALYPVEKLRARGYVLDKEDRVSYALSRLDHSFARQIHSCIDTDRVPAWNMVEWIDILLNAIQIADDSTSNSSLRYYQQREWRIIQLLSPLIDCHAVNPTARVAGARFFNDRQQRDVLHILQKHGVMQGFDLDLENTFILCGTTERTLRSFVREVIVPATCVEHQQNYQGRHSLRFSQGVT